MKGWKEVKASDPDSLFAQLDAFSQAWGRCLARGQADSSWPLQTTIDRGVPTQAAHSFRFFDEGEIIKEFVSSTSQLWTGVETIYMNEGSAHDRVRKMVVMQHYGAPTRLLDWTESLHVALYFACISSPECDGAMWIMNDNNFDYKCGLRSNELKATQVDSETIDYNLHLKDPPVPFVGPVGLIRPFERAHKQQAKFTIAGELGKNHDDLIAEILPSRDRGRIIIDARIKGRVLEILRMRNVTAASLLYNGADSIGLRMAWERQQKCKTDTPTPSR